jgi:hypothetical protein
MYVNFCFDVIFQEEEKERKKKKKKKNKKKVKHVSCTGLE